MRAVELLEEKAINVLFGKHASNKLCDNLAGNQLATKRLTTSFSNTHLASIEIRVTNHKI